MRAFAAIHPNHGDRPAGLFRTVFWLSRHLFSDTTEPRPFWYGC
jgi:hypothetical protein